jgi:hypothetical protein
MSLILTSISIPQTSVSFSTMALMFFPFPLFLESIVSNSTFPHTSLKAACASCVIAKLNFQLLVLLFLGRL